MGILDRFSKKNQTEELTEIYKEIINMHQLIESLENQFLQFNEIKGQLQEAHIIKQSAHMVSEKLDDLYKDVQLISEAIQNDDKETRDYIHQSVNQIEQMSKNIKEINDSFEEKNTQYQQSTQQLQSQLDQWNKQLHEEQKKNEQVLAELKKETLEKELALKKQIKQRDLVILVAFLVIGSLSVYGLWN